MNSELPYIKELLEDFDREGLYKEWYKQWAAENYYYITNKVTCFGNPLLPANLPHDIFAKLVKETSFYKDCEKALFNVS